MIKEVKMKDVVYFSIVLCIISLMTWTPTAAANIDCETNYTICVQEYDDSVKNYGDKHCCLTAKLQWCVDSNVMPECKIEIAKAKEVIDAGFKDRKCFGRKKKSSPLCWLFYSRKYWLWGSVAAALFFTGSCLCCLWKCLCCRKLCCWFWNACAKD